MSNYKRINVRLTKLNQEQLIELHDYVAHDPWLRKQIKSDNQLMNFVMSEFMFLFCHTMQGSQVTFDEREKQLLTTPVTSDQTRELKQKLTHLDQQSSQLMYLVMSIYNRNAGDVQEGGSIYTPGAVNNTTKQLLREMIEGDYQKNKLRQG